MGPGYAGETRLVWLAVHRLRRKLEPDHQKPQFIVTKPGIGYLLTKAD